MTEEQKAAYINAQAAVLMAQVAGMQAENMQRLHRGESIAYPEDAFTAVINASACHHNAVMEVYSP